MHGHYTSQGADELGLDQAQMRGYVIQPKDTPCCSRRCPDCHRGGTPSAAGNYCCGSRDCGDAYCVHSGRCETGAGGMRPVPTVGD